VPAAKPRPWNEGMDNLGENLVRLGTALKAIEGSPSTSSTDASFAASMEQVVTGYRVAFRQTLPVLVRSERSFLHLVPASLAAELSTHPREDSPQHAHTFLHEGILACQEIASLLDRVDRSCQAQPGDTRLVLQSSLAPLSDSTASVGWEIRTICHEYESEVQLAGIEPEALDDFGAGSVGMIHDLAAAAHHLRSARREWFRVEQRLAAAVGGREGPMDAAEP
jgi:hypothetical protein